MKAEDMILYTDMDGTALSDWELGPYVPEQNLQAIRYFTEAGGLFSVASGRLLDSILKWFPEGLINAPVVCSNGSLLQDPVTREILYGRQLPRDYLTQALDFTAQHLEDVTLLTANEEAIWHVEIEKGQADADGWLRRTMTPEDYLAGSCFKICYILRDPNMLDSVTEQVSRFPQADQVTAVASAPTCLEIIPKGINKALGTRQAQQLAGARNRTLVCIGDFYNDLEMLREADIAACPAQSPKEIQDLCQIHCCHNNNGAIADLLRQLLTE